MNKDLLELILGIGVVVALLIVGFTAGTMAERRHYRSIRSREKQLRKIMLFAVRTPPDSMLPCRTEFVSGSVVVGMDYFKRYLAMLKNLIGGRVGSYETLIDRARREAVLRMKQEAKELNASCVFNIKFSTANIMSGANDNKGAGCVEVIAYGTAIIPKK